MSRKYNENSMLKSNGIEYYPPVKDFSKAKEIFNDCGGMILSLEEDGFLVEDPLTISKLYDIPVDHLEHYFRDTLSGQNIEKEEIEKIISSWLIEENINEL